METKIIQAIEILIKDMSENIRKISQQMSLIRVEPYELGEDESFKEKYSLSFSKILPESERNESEKKKIRENDLHKPFTHFLEEKHESPIRTRESAIKKGIDDRLIEEKEKKISKYFYTKSPI